MGAIRQSRWSTAPTVDTNGRIREHTIYATDIELFRWTGLYPCVTTELLAALTGRNRTAINTRFRTLKRDPGPFLKAVDPVKKLDAVLWYALTEKARELVKGYGSPVHTNEFSGSSPYHTLYSVYLRASFAIAARVMPEITERPWHDLAADSRLPIPHETRSSETPHYIQIPRHIQRKGHATRLIPDCYPFLLKSGERGYGIVIEADMGTESIAAKVAAKIAYYVWFLESGEYKKQWGFPQLYVCFVTIFPGRVPNILDEIGKQTEHNPSLRNFFLVSDEPAAHLPGERTRVTEHMVTRHWQRYQKQPFCFEKKAA